MKILSYLLFILLSSIIGGCSSSDTPESTEPQPAVVSPTISESDHEHEGNGTTSLIETPYIVVLGTAQDAGFPQAGCKKVCCATAGHRGPSHQPVACLGLILPQSGERYLFDATPDFPEQLHHLNAYPLPSSEPTDGQINTGTISGIFLTHAHIGHYTGLMHLGREVMGARHVPVYAMPRMREFLSNNGPWSQLVSLDNIRLTNLADGLPIDLASNVNVTPFQVPHRDEFSETVGFRVKGPERSVIFLPDIDKWEKWDQDILKVIRENDAVFLDGTFFANGEIPGRDMSEIPHPFVEESIALFSQLSEEERAKVHFIHFNHTNPLLKAESDARKQVEQAGMQLAHWGQIVEL